MKITMIGHSTLLIETNGQKVVTDPYFGAWGNIAYRRLKPPALPRETLRDTHMVLLSHNHWDHVDRPFLRSLAVDVPVVTPWQTASLTRLQGAKKVVGLKPWESWQMGEIRITAVPAIHLAATLGYVVQSESKQIYFAGDTYFGAFMQQIGQQFQLEAVLMPVTTYRLPMTMGEQQAVRAAQALRPGVIIPIHLGIQPRSPLLGTSQTPAGFARQVQSAGLTTRVVILDEGEAWEC